MAALNTYKIRSATLLEVLVALVIILIVFVLAMGIYTNVLRGSNQISQLKASALARQMLTQSIHEANWGDEQRFHAGFVIQKTVSPYLSHKDLIVISITVSNQGRQIAQWKSLIKKHAHGNH